MKLSIIVPVFNIEFFIKPCLESIINVNLDYDEYEVIVIDDGSTDNSLAIINEFAADFKQIKVFSQKNKGLGSARNKGIEYASGDYIWFVDGDDLVNSENVASALIFACNQDLDVLAFDFQPVNEKGGPENWIEFKLKYKKDLTVTGPEFYLLNFAKSYIWLYFFRRKLFSDNNLAFEDSIKMQDGEIMPRIMLHCSTIKYLDKKLISYRFRENSAVNHKNETTRAHFYYSMVIVAHKLRILQQSLQNNDLMFKALGYKRNQLNQMLFTNLILNNYSKQTNIYFIKLLKEYRLLPFQKITGFTSKMNLVYNLIRRVVNINPYRGRQLYHGVFTK
ncbi:MAG TPA: glycosyltransferase [Anditalea sp.]|nr:glycosyltransferase [Anditalea sp.]